MGRKKMVTIGDLKDEVNAALESGRLVDREAARRLRDELTQLGIDNIRVRTRSGLSENVDALKIEPATVDVIRQKIARLFLDEVGER